MENLIVMKEETVESLVPASFIVEDYSEEVSETVPVELNIGQEVYIDHDQVTYEVLH